jgi:hypothetical protein
MRELIIPTEMSRVLHLIWRPVAISCGYLTGVLLRDGSVLAFLPAILLAMSLGCAADEIRDRRHEKNREADTSAV